MTSNFCHFPYYIFEAGGSRRKKNLLPKQTAGDEGKVYSVIGSAGSQTGQANFPASSASISVCGRKVVVVEVEQRSRR